MSNEGEISPRSALRILVVEDSPDMLSAYQLVLEGEGFEVDLAACGLTALKKLHENDYDLIITDIRMPGMDGGALISRVRETGMEVPIIVVTVRSDLELFSSIRLPNKDIRDDDILDRPVEKEDLIAAVRDKLKRVAELKAAAGAAQEGLEPTFKGTLKTGDLVIDLDRHIVTVKGETVHLTPTEFELLACLANDLDFVVSCQELVKQVHKYHCDDESEAREIIRPHIKNLRRKIEPNPDSFMYIINVRGVGYKLVKHLQN